MKISTENKINAEQLCASVCVGGGGGGDWCTLTGFASCSDHVTTTYGAIHQITKQIQFDYNIMNSTIIAMPGKYQSLLQWNTMP